MASQRRKSKIPFQPKPHSGTVPQAVAQLAAEYEIDLAGLLSWKVYSSGKVVLIAANGMKFVRDAPEGVAREAAEGKPRSTPDSALRAVEGAVREAIDE